MGMWGVTAYFNPAGYRTKLENLVHCADRVRRQGLKLMIVEAALGDRPHEVPENLGDVVVRVRARSVLWHKERLLNVGILRLPSECEQVAWLDGDLLFENHAWVAETSRLLREYAIVQPYDRAVRLPRGLVAGDSIAPTYVSTAYAQAHGFRNLTDLAGHPGFVWAARREILAPHGLYDRCILGGGDLAIAFAVYRDEHSTHLQTWMSEFCSVPHRRDLTAWLSAFHRRVAGGVSYGDGAVLHLWHGESTDRRYATRPRILIEHDFDPEVDIGVSADGCWEWTSAKAGLHDAVSRYFRERREDG